MKKLFLAIVLALLPLESEAQIPGQVSVYNVAGTWTVFKETGVVLPTPGTTTCGVNEALAYAYPLGLPVTVFGQGVANKCNIVNSTVIVPPQRFTPFHCFGCHWFFDNQGQDGVVFDTQMFSSWKFEGAIEYSGTGAAVKFKPTAGLYYASVAMAAPWSVEQIYDLGHLAMIECVVGTLPNCTRLGLNSTALLKIDLDTTCGVDQFHSSSFVLNKVNVNGMEGWNKANQLFWYQSPSCQYSTGGENWFNFGLMQSGQQIEILIGFIPNNPLDANLGTNEYRANIAHANGTTFAIFSNTIQDRFHLTSMNAYGPVVPFMVWWGPNAYGNRIITQQSFGWTVMTQSTGTPAWPNVICGYSAATAC